MPSLTDDGLTVLRTADYLDRIRERFEAETGLGPDWEVDTLLGQLTAIMAQELGELSEAVQAVYDATDVNGATGVQLSNLARIVGIQRRPATYSQVVVTLAGTPLTAIPAGAVVEGGGDDGRARWVTTADATLGAGGTVSVVARAEEAGRVVADLFSITTIVSPISGWTSVTNSSTASLGIDAETDDQLRTRRQASLQIAGGRSLAAIRAALLELDFVTAAAVIDNPTPLTTVIEGVSMPGNSYLAVIYPTTLTATQEAEVLRVLYDTTPIGVQPAGTDVTGFVTGLDGFDKDVAFDYPAEIVAPVTVTVTLEAGYDIANVGPDLEQAIEDAIDALSVGDDLRHLALCGLAAGIDGIATAVTLINGSSADLVAAVSEKIVHGTVTVSL